MEVVEIVLRTLFLSMPVAGWRPLGQELSAPWIGDVQPVPIRAMNGQEPAAHLRKGKGERRNLRVIVAAIERQRLSPSLQVDDLAELAMVVHDRREVTARRGMKATPWAEIPLGLLIHLGHQGASGDFRPFQR